MAMDLKRVETVCRYYERVLRTALDAEFNSFAVTDSHKPEGFCQCNACYGGRMGVRAQRRVGRGTDAFATQKRYLLDMLGRMPVGEERREKIFRWYGFVQGALWACGVFTVDELKAHSNPDVPPPQF